MPPITTTTYAKEFKKVIEAAARGRQVFTVQVCKIYIVITLIKHSEVLSAIIFSSSCINQREPVWDSVWLVFAVRIKESWVFSCRRYNPMA